MLMLRKHVVIIGGGWGGMALARHLRKIPKNKIRISLISDDQNFRYSPGLYRVATGHREKEAVIPITDLTAKIDSLEFIKARATHINRSKKIVNIEGGQEIHYDYLVISVGAVTNFFDIPGLKERSFGIKTPREIHKFRAHLHQTLIDDKKPDKNYVVVGGGPTGVELSAALASYIKKVTKRHGLPASKINIELVQAGSRLIPQSQPKASKLVLTRLRKLGVKVHLNAKVEGESEDSLRYNNRSIPTRTVIWTAGTTNNALFKAHRNHFPLSPSGRVIVDERLRVDAYTYVIGDNAETLFSGLAFTAVQNAKYVASDIKKRLYGQLKTPYYRPLQPLTAIPVGARWAVFQRKNIVISGFLGGVLRSFADLVGYIDIAGFGMGLKLWLGSSHKEEKCYICQTAIKKEDWVTQSSYS